jgi:hypothetical protein
VIWSDEPNPTVPAKRKDYGSGPVGEGGSGEAIAAVCAFITLVATWVLPWVGDDSLTYDVRVTPGMWMIVLSVLCLVPMWVVSGAAKDLPPQRRHIATLLSGLTMLGLLWVMQSGLSSGVTTWWTFIEAHPSWAFYVAVFMSLVITLTGALSLLAWALDNGKLGRFRGARGG